MAGCYFFRFFSCYLGRYFAEVELHSSRLSKLKLKLKLDWLGIVGWMVSIWGYGEH